MLEPLRTRIDLDRFDAVVLELETVAADLGYGDVRALSGAVACIDHLREHDKRIALVDGGERGEAALAIAGIADRIELTAPTIADGARGDRRRRRSARSPSPRPPRASPPPSRPASTA